MSAAKWQNIAGSKKNLYFTGTKCLDYKPKLRAKAMVSKPLFQTWWKLQGRLEDHQLVSGALYIYHPLFEDYFYVFNVFWEKYVLIYG